MTRSPAWLGIDTGGTFTDFVWYEPSTNELKLMKVPSDPLSVESVCRKALERLDRSLADVERAVHGTTLVTNTVLEGKGARVGVVTTEGFRDVIELGRQGRSEMYNLKTLAIKPLSPRRWRHEVAERTAADGTVLMQPSKSDVDKAIRQLERDHIEAVAVCFLFSHLTPDNEREVAGAVRKDREWFVTASHEVVRQAREYERFSTTVMNAYVAPRVSAYLDSLQHYFEEEDVSPERVFLIGATGGAMSWPTARTVPVNLLNSGPAGGVRGAVEVSRSLGMRDIITYDMGGTSTDVCLVKDLEPRVSSEGNLEGRPLVVPRLDIATIGAGGGSIAWVDIGGELRVGPQSAGANPGPACYGLGGTEPTVTDANVVLGRLDSGHLLGGSVRVDAAAAWRSVESLARRFHGIGVEEMAAGIISIAVAKMRTAIGEVSVARGLDPRDFVLVAYGGAGPMHASDLAKELGIEQVVVPFGPGNFSALGLLMSNVRHDFVRSRYVGVSQLTVDQYEAIYGELEAEAIARLESEGFRPETVVTSRTADMRYSGQWFELNVAMPVRPASMEEVDRRFRTAHLDRFRLDMARPTEFVNFRLAAEGITTKPRLGITTATDHGSASPAKRSMVFDGARLDVPVYTRERMPAGATFTGPCVIEEFGATTVVIDGFSGVVDASGAMVLTSRQSLK